MKPPKYKLIAEFIKSKLESMIWQEGYKIPSETELATQFSASRMTARKAVDEMVNLGLLERVPSVGTFVRSILPQSSLLEIKNIADEILSRGHTHKMTVLSKLLLVPNDAIAISFSLQNKNVFKIIIIHFENDSPIQLEERYVNAEKVPFFLQQDFSKITAHQYLTSVAPLTEADISVEAVMPTKILKHNLQLNDNTPCLKVTRSTYSNGQPISYVVLYHPANKFRLTSAYRTAQ
ncbi:MAG: UTRA domain-containing protein [Paraglaciecola polaris]|uniref:UTRA domain-containing protein n=1 Tax=Paraglaciecola polaris TaxID=222814 RepID=UPI003001D576